MCMWIECVVVAAVCPIVFVWPCLYCYVWRGKQTTFASSMCRDQLLYLAWLAPSEERGSGYGHSRSDLGRTPKTRIPALYLRGRRRSEGGERERGRTVVD